MPARGDLQRQAHQIPNPFDEEPPRIQEYTAKEIAILQSRLEKQLGPEYISSRKGPGGHTVHYLGAEKIIQIANEVFGFNGWSTSIRDTTIDYVDIEKDGRVSMGLSVIMRVTLKDGTYHEDVGYGMITNCTGKGAAFEKTKKEAATDAMKRALRNFGNVLGNCLYDKDYLKKVVKIKPPPSKWSEDNLYRHQDVVPRKQLAPEFSPEIATEKATSLPATRHMSAQSKTSGMATDYDDEFGGNAFDDVDFTRSDEFMVHDTSALDGEEDISIISKQEVNESARQTPQRSHTVPPQQQRPPAQPMQRPPAPPPQSRPAVQQRPVAPPSVGNAAAQPPQAQRAQTPQQSTDVAAGRQPPGPNGQQRATSSTPELVQQRQTMQPPIAGAPGNQQTPDPPAVFVRGRVADMLQGGQIPTTGLFNPHAESPSIRKTSGFNHRTSGPVRREDIGAPAAPVVPPTGGGQTFAPPRIQPETRPPQQIPQAQPIQANVDAPPAVPRSNFINPQQDPHRRIGAPMHPGMQSPGMRTSVYKPPGPAGLAGQKRGAPDAGVVQARPPLSDVSNNVKAHPPHVVDAGSGDAAKRMRLQGADGGVGPEGQVAAS